MEGREVRLARLFATIGLTIAALLLAAGGSAEAATLPSIGAVEATNIEGISALLRGQVNPNGSETTYRFEYVDQAAFSQSGYASATKTQEATLPAVSEDRPVTAAISGLTPDTTYHVRIVATNSAGSEEGPDETFTTTHGFGLLNGAEGFSVGALELDRSPDLQAGTHPYEFSTTIRFNRAGEFAGQPGVVFPDGDLKDLHLELPPGLVGNPTVVAKCTLAQFNTPRVSPYEESLSGESCPDTSQVGVVTIHTSLGGGQTRSFGIYNLTPPPGNVVELGFSPFGSPVTWTAHVRNAGSEYALTADIHNFPERLSADSVRIALWGTPFARYHDTERGNCLNEVELAEPWAKCSVGPPASVRREAFLTVPTSCAGPLTYRLEVDSWQQPGRKVGSAVRSRNEAGDPEGMQGCELLSLETVPTGGPTTPRASSASGFEFNLEVKQEGLTEPAGRAASQIRNAELLLPAGLTINPSVGAGLGICSAAQYASETAASASGAACPDESKIGSIRIATPLLEEEVTGSVFLAKPFQNPFGALIGVYIVAKAPTQGVIIKVPGELVPNQSDGRLTAIFKELPQFPYSHLHIFFREGQRAPLASPSSCGNYPIQTELTPWLNPNLRLHHSSEFTISSGVGGGPCPGSGLPPFSPGASDGSLNANAGSYSPYYLHLTRQDTEQEITLYSALLPPGLTGKIAGVPFCSNADIEAARVKSGIEELEHPSCPAASEIGHTISGYGLGNVLDYAPGKLYLTGPYHGAPLSITAVDSALVGPFDLGVVIVRSAIKVNPYTTQVSIDSAGSDPIPHILAGIPIHLRDIRVYINRPEFTLNPTSCEPFQATSTLMGAGARISDPSDDVPATASSLYQATNCSSLKFEPKLSIRLLGATHRGAYPSLRGVVEEPPGNANIGSAVVSLPRTEFLAQNHIDSVCRLPVFEAHGCNSASVYGYARAFTPLLSEPAEGPVYLVSSPNHALPNLVADLRGENGLEVAVRGQVESALGGGMRANFQGLPDAPASKFVIELFGGNRGLLQNSANVCATKSFATARFVGQNNSPWPMEVPIGANCHGRGGRHHKRNHDHRRIHR
jgi:hypothetical protein